MSRLRPNEDREYIQDLRAKRPNHTAKDWIEEALHINNEHCSDDAICLANMLYLASDSLASNQAGETPTETTDIPSSTNDKSHAEKSQDIENTANLNLDNTLRYLYHALSKRGGYLMAIRFKYAERTWEADSPGEAIALRHQLENDETAAIEAGRESWPEQNPWTPDLVTDLWESLGNYQKVFLKMMFESENGVTSEEVIQKLNLGSEVAFAGVLSGLSKQLKKLELRTWDLYFSATNWKPDKSKIRTFRLSFGFRFQARELGFPKDWD